MEAAGAAPRQEAAHSPHPGSSSEPPPPRRPALAATTGRRTAGAERARGSGTQAARRGRRPGSTRRPARGSAGGAATCIIASAVPGPAIGSRCGRRGRCKSAATSKCAHFISGLLVPLSLSSREKAGQAGPGVLFAAGGPAPAAPNPAAPAQRPGAPRGSERCGPIGKRKRRPRLPRPLPLAPRRYFD